MRKITTIRLEPETRDRFKEQGKKGETFDRLLNRILDEIEEYRKNKAEQGKNDPCPA